MISCGSEGVLKVKRCLTADIKMERDLSETSVCHLALEHVTKYLGGLPHIELQTTSEITFKHRHTNLSDSFLKLLVRLIINDSFC